MTHIAILRTPRGPRGRARVAHAFSDEDYWFPFRSGLCGKEYDASLLTDEGAEDITLCQGCSKRLAALRETAA